MSDPTRSACNGRRRRSMYCCEYRIPALRPPSRRPPGPATQCHPRWSRGSRRSGCLAMAKATRGDQMVGPVLRHLCELIRPDQWRYTHPGADRVVRVQHCLDDRCWRSALGSYVVPATARWIARGRWAVTVGKLGVCATRRGHQKRHPPRIAQLWSFTCPLRSLSRAPMVREPIQGVIYLHCRLAFDGPAVASVAPSRRRQDFRIRWVVIAKGASLRGIRKGSADGGLPSVRSGWSSSKSSIRHASRHSGQWLSAKHASRRTMSCVIMEVARHW